MKEKMEKGEGRGEKSMRQPHTDFGQRGESGEKFPKGVTSSDKASQKHEKMHGGVGQGEADKTGNQEFGKGRHEHHMGKHDGRLGEFNHGKLEEHHEVYAHERVPHVQDEGFKAEESKRHEMKK